MLPDTPRKILWLIACLASLPLLYLGYWMAKRRDLATGQARRGVVAIATLFFLENGLLLGLGLGLLFYRDGSWF